jgi:predicted YcjX-like family ATPase
MMNQTNDKPDKWEKLAQELKEIKGNENISDELAERVIDFLRQLAELEIKMIEEGRFKNKPPITSAK